MIAQRVRLLLPVGLALWTALAFGADFWKQKEFTSWSEKECMRILRDSPWSFVNRFQRVNNIGSVETGERETTELIEFRLLSAKPIQLAFAQLQLLSQPGNKMLRTAVEGQIQDPPGDEILVQISYRAIPASSGILQDLHTFFGHASTSTFVDSTFLISSEGLSVPLTEFRPWTPQRPNALFVFPRFDEQGKPYFSGQEKSISLRSEFKVGPTPEFRSIQYKIFGKLKPRDMVFRDRFEM